MKQRGRFWEGLAREADLEGECFPGQSLVEILGQHRVLVEHHRGVIQYSRETVGIRVSWGIVQSCGCGLELRRMSAEQLIVCGQIHQIQLRKGC